VTQDRYRAEPWAKRWRSLLTGTTVLWTPPVVEPEPDPDPPPPVDTIVHGTDLALTDVGPRPGTTFVNQSGPIFSQFDGEVIRNRNLTYAGANGTATLTIRHNNVIVRDCKFAGADRSNQIAVDAGVSGVVIEYCRIDGLKAKYGTDRATSNFGNFGVYCSPSAQIDIRRCFVTGCRSGIRIGVGSHAWENWVEDLTPPAQGASTSAIGFRGGSPYTQTIIERNRLETGTSNALAMYASSGPIRNLDIDDNYIVGVGVGFGMYGGHINPGGTVRHHDNNQNIKIDGNRFAGTFAYMNVLGEGTNAATNVNQPGNTFTNNRWLPGNGTVVGDLPARCGVRQDACE
jgi:hypothetical protein